MRTIIEHLSRRFGSEIVIYLFGSEAAGRARADSDIDIAIVARSLVRAGELEDERRELERQLMRDVDLIDLRSVNPVMSARIVTGGKRIHDGDAVMRRAFETLAIARYMDFNEIRAPILARIRKQDESMADDILLAKASIIERSVRRAREELKAAGANFATDFTRQDAALLNVNRACEAAIQMAAHTVARLSLGLPGNAREAFELLGEAAVIDRTLSKSLIAMVGFRNIAVHAYRELDLLIAQDIISHRLDDLLTYSAQLVRDHAFDEET